MPGVTDAPDFGVPLKFMPCHVLYLLYLPHLVSTGVNETPERGVPLKFMQFNVLADGLSGEDPDKGGKDKVKYSEGGVKAGCGSLCALHLLSHE